MYKEEAKLNICKVVIILGLAVTLLFEPLNVAFAQDEEFFVRKSIITKRDAIVLSAIFPGIGQMTSGQKAKGITFFLAEAFSLVMFINAHENYSTKEKIYERDLGVLDTIDNYNDFIVQKKSLIDKNDELDNLNTIRNAALIAAGTVYVYNIIDAVFFSSSSTQSQRVGKDNKRIIVQTALIDSKPGILLSKSF